MTRYIIRRMMLMIPTLFFLYTVLFILVRVIPGDIVDIYLEGGTQRAGQSLEETRQAMREDLGIGSSIPEQYIVSLGALARGDLGTSLQTRQPVTDEIVRRIPITLQVAAVGTLFALMLAIPAGVISAIRQRTALDQAVRVASIVSLSVPNFWLGTMIVLFPALWWGYGAPSIYQSPFDDLAANLRQVLPAAFVLGTALGGSTTRFMRSSLLEVLRQDYIRTAWSKGLNETRVVRRHALKNAMIPVITVIGLQMGNLFGGSVITENIFNIPGLGTLTLTAIRVRDYTQLQANMLLFGFVVAMMSLVVDISYAWLDPRIRYS
ncbi:MAG: ABC transporter permease [Dehalococcoidia bacterium]